MTEFSTFNPETIGLDLTKPIGAACYESKNRAPALVGAFTHLGLQTAIVVPGGMKKIAMTGEIPDEVQQLLLLYEPNSPEELYTAWMRVKELAQARNIPCVTWDWTNASIVIEAAIRDGHMGPLNVVLNE